MIQRQVQKGIHQFSNAELIEVIKNWRNNDKIKEAKAELEKRNLSKEQYDKALKEYKKFIAYKLKRKEQSLELGEILFFFFVPFGKSRSMFGAEDYVEDETDRFREYAFDNKYLQVRKIRLLGILFYIVLSLLPFAIRAMSS